MPTDWPADQAAALQSTLDLSLRIAIVAVTVIWSTGIAAWPWRRAHGIWDRPLLA